MAVEKTSRTDLKRLALQRVEEDRDEKEGEPGEEIKPSSERPQRQLFRDLRGEIYSEMLIAL